MFVYGRVVTMEQDNAPANDAARGMRTLLVGGLHGDTDRVVTAVHKRGDALFNGRLDWLGELWAVVKGLRPTTDLILACWKGHVDGTAALSHRKADTKAATAFTLARFADWPGRLQAWIDHPEVLEHGFKMYPTKKALHYLSCIINQVAQVG